MASEAVLKELFQVSMASSAFKGISKEDVWNACLAYKDRSDEDIGIAMDNIRKKDQAIIDKADEQKKHLEQNKEKMAALHEEEAGDRKQDEQNAEKILEELFKM
ncbi:hypothetical protein KJ657_02830 [Patescibacteria group bacterium]|nr:hypothetical protein [Patescibacteria group bacterium]MBU1015999.1 hypothetical protein [Patescibacteria group bacterium]MBU1684792.1 hypothetical protein [Patescibacteria group bacterium]MBU1938762.1 hypothetical protein [Patescibacteria group bacterium]